MKKLFWVGLLLACQYIYGSTVIDSKLQQLIYHERVKQKVNAISLSVSFPRQNSIHNYVTGTISQENHTPISAKSLFQVGSITKNFTAVLIGSVDNSFARLRAAACPRHPVDGQIKICILLIH